MISDIIDTRNIGTLLLAWINFNPCMDKKYSVKCGYKIIYPSPNFNGRTVDGWEWISNFTSNFIMDVITYPCWD